MTHLDKAEENLWEELNAAALPLALRILEPYSTEGGITTCYPFLIFSFSLLHWPFLGYSNPPANFSFLKQNNGTW